MVETQDGNLRKLLSLAVERDLISRPHPVALPSGLPFRAAVCTLRLPDGCLPPKNHFGLRVGSGTGPTEDAAAFLALSEAAERYSLQFSGNRPQALAPIAALPDRPEPALISELTLGAPGVSPSSSHGAAAGATLDQAIERACLETLEHHHVKRNGRLIGAFEELDARQVTVVHEHIAYLETQLRELDVRLLSSPFGYFVAHATCRDRDQGRRTFGAAASTCLESAVLRAGEEAILLWRNMVEMERYGVTMTDLASDNSDQFLVYRGALPMSLEIVAKDNPVTPKATVKPSFPEIIHSVTDTGVRIFDMTVAELKVPVAKVTLDQS